MALQIEREPFFITNDAFFVYTPFLRLTANVLKQMSFTDANNFIFFLPVRCQMPTESRFKSLTCETNNF